MNNVRQSKINIDSIKEFFVSGNRPLLVSATTISDLERNELPLVNTGVLTEERPVAVQPVEVTPQTPLVNANPTNLFVAGESLKSGFDVTEQTPVVEETKIEIPEVEVPEVEIPLVSKEPLEASIPSITPVEITPQTPLVAGNPNNVFIKTGSALTGFDVTGQTPVIEQSVETPVMPMDDGIVETAINEQIEQPVLPESESVGIEDIHLETPQDFNESLEPTPAPINEVPQATSEDPYITANAEIEKIRSEFNKKIDEITSEIQTLREATNMSLDNVSRNVEKARQISQNDASAILGTVQNELNNINGLSYNNGLSR